MRFALLAGTVTGLVALTGAARATPTSVTFLFAGYTQSYSVPETGTFRITAIGGQGGGTGGSYAPGGFGEEVSGTFNLAAGTLLRIAVGGEGQYQPGAAGGGGGGSFVVTFDSAAPLLIAGGGGGAGSVAGGNAQAGTAGERGTPRGAAGGVNGLGGGAGSDFGAGGGGGFLGDGYSAAPEGGQGGSGFPYLDGGSGFGAGDGAFGGGGGGSAGPSNDGGGGGGYSGGGGGAGGGGGGGGGSFNAGLDPLSSLATRGGLGEVVITEVPASGTVPEPTGMAMFGVALLGLFSLRVSATRRACCRSASPNPSPGRARPPPPQAACR